MVPLNNLASDQVMNKKKKKKEDEISVAQRLNKWIMVVHLWVRGPPSSNRPLMTAKTRPVEESRHFLCRVSSVLSLILNQKANQPLLSQQSLLESLSRDGESVHRLPHDKSFVISPPVDESINAACVTSEITQMNSEEL